MTAASYDNYPQREYELICEAEALLDTKTPAAANEWLASVWPLDSECAPPFIAKV